MRRPWLRLRSSCFCCCLDRIRASRQKVEVDEVEVVVEVVVVVREVAVVEEVETALPLPVLAVGGGTFTRFV